MLKEGNPQILDVGCDGNRCPRKNIVVNPELVGYGEEVVGLLGEAPYEEEERYGRPFIGRSGLVLRKYLDLNRYKYLIFNSIQCLSRRENNTSIKPSEMIKDEVSKRFNNCESIRNSMIDMLSDNGTLILFGNYARRAIFIDYRKFEVSTKPYMILINGKLLNVYVNYHPAYVLYRNSMIDEFEKVLKATGKFKMI